jgi:triosephosphate isomerase
MLIAGNWKMNTDLDRGRTLAENVAAGAGEVRDDVDLLVCPPHSHLAPIGRALEGSGVALGAQNVHAEDSGSFTGEVSAPMLTSAGCSHVIVGHSERRRHFGETDDDVNAKLRRAQAHELVPVVCVGETLEDRQDGRAREVVGRQVGGALDGVSIDEAAGLVVAYEPVWAIGTGESATPEQAQEMHAFVHDRLEERLGPVGREVHVVYGGSMKPWNAEELLGQPDVDGGLIGGASLQADSFLAIAEHGADAVKREA